MKNPAAITDTTKSPGLSPAATALRIATEDLITELRTRQPELAAGSDVSWYSEALHYASMARQLLNYHAAHAGKSGFASLLGIRDALMADNLAYIVERERGRGKALAFAHNAHLQRGPVAVWPSWQKALGTDGFTWRPAGSHLEQRFGPHYSVIGTAVGVSEANGIGDPEPGTLDARLVALPGPCLFIPTYRGRAIPAAERAALPVRSDSMKNLTYTTLSPQSLTDFDGVVVLDSVTYTRGGRPLPNGEEGSSK